MLILQFDSRLLVMPLSEDIPLEKIGGHNIRIQAPSGKGVNQTLIDLNIKFAQAVTAVINGQTTDLDRPLEPGDEVRLLPQIAGGY